MNNWLIEPNQGCTHPVLKSIINYIFSPTYRINAKIRHVGESKGWFSEYLSRRLLMKHGVHVSSKTIIGTGVFFPHPIGVVIGEGVVLGNNITIYQGVTIGKNHGGYPVVMDGTTIYSNSIIVGSITIGCNSIIGAGSVVVTNVPDSCIYAGSPARNIHGSHNS